MRRRIELNGVRSWTAWLEPLHEGSLQNINIHTRRTRKQQVCRREQWIKSGLAKVVMFLPRSDVESTLNRRLANDLGNR